VRFCQKKKVQQGGGRGGGGKPSGSDTMRGGGGVLVGQWALWLVIGKKAGFHLLNHYYERLVARN